eukprot:CAMPEP_0115390836 /NCGR_PEP_ID=MMETSP0271-20121206/10403_1 /TAXON_ID=71861 /ORGANISM="Scrippsiella trochoidea, Strain CCMP3099" /LENGTH=431 /DNA_ID=CAMNT_0002814383 /DNA_START=29 /DNA_END=1324 /DNA_ORIENTATION=-
MELAPSSRSPQLSDGPRLACCCCWCCCCFWLQRERESEPESIEPSAHVADLGETLLNDASTSCVGLRWDLRALPMGLPSDELERRVVEETQQKVIENLSLRRWGQSVGFIGQLPKEQGGRVHLFVDKTPAATVGGAPAGGRNLLGRYDVVVVKARAERDHAWSEIQGPQHSFWVAHVAALNAGEGDRAADFYDFSHRTGLTRRLCLNEEAYCGAMQQILGNVARACATLAPQHLIFYPIGMGASLRQLESFDPRYSDHQAMQRLRRNLADASMKALASTPDSIRIHLCLSFGPRECEYDGDAFLRAVIAPDTDMGRLRDRLTIYRDADALDLARRLTSASPDKVVLVNDTSRELIGNHWFSSGAKQTVDENLHRRSPSMSTIAYVLNGGGGPRHARAPDELEKNVERLNGRLHTVRQGDGGIVYVISWQRA